MRAKATATATALSAACFALVALAPAARASAVPLEIYQAGGSGQGLVLTGAVRPSVLDPLVEGGALVARSTLSSQGGGSGYALASQVFPGTLVVGFAGCLDYPAIQWVQATYPATGACPSSAENRLGRTSPSTQGAAQGHPEFDALANQLFDRTSLDVGHISADTGNGRAEASVLTNEFALRQEASGTPLVEFAQLDAHSGGARAGARVGHRVRVALQGIKLLGGLVRIESLVSTSETVSDGVTATAKARLALGDVTIEADGAQHAATIDSDGVRVTDPALSKEQNANLTEDLREDLARAGLRISTGRLNESAAGQQAEASVGGLQISVAGRLPSIAVPEEAAPVFGALIDNVKTQCVWELEPPQAPQVPLCFGSGAVPLGGSTIALTISIGTADSYSVGSRIPLAGGTTSVLGSHFWAKDSPPAAPGVDFASSLNSYQDTPPAQPTGPVTLPPLFGLAARMPSSALAFAGIAFLILALASALGPSLRHAGPGRSE
ncbi:MAG: hypothetical protein WDA27_05980 [Actinomycetota bacterium]